jgi:hypothetical protein
MVSVSHTGVGLGIGPVEPMYGCTLARRHEAGVPAVGDFVSGHALFSRGDRLGEPILFSNSISFAKLT